MTTSNIPSHQLTTVQIQQEMRPKICLVSTPKAQTTGCFVSQDGLIVTAFHILSIIGNQITSEDISIKHLDKNYTVEFPKGQYFDLAKALDICLLKIKEKVQVPFFSIINTDERLLEGQEVYFSGFPLSQTTLTFHKGMISSLSEKDIKPVTFTIDGTIVPGNSGGPVTMLIKNKLYLAGIITNEVADLGSGFERVEWILNKLKKQETLPGSEIEMEKHDGTKERSTIGKEIINMMDILKRNISTGIGKATDARQIPDLTNALSILNYKDLLSQSSVVLVAKKPVMAKGTREGHQVQYWENFRGNSEGKGPRGIDIKVGTAKVTYYFDLNPHNKQAYNNKGQTKFYYKAFNTFFSQYLQNNVFPEEFSFKIFKETYTATLQE